MGSFGERMRREREARKISLEDISEATKISTRSLRALEQEDFDKLPGGIFNKGFVRAYARHLGIDEDQAVAEFVAAAGEAEQPLPDPVEPRANDMPRIREDPQWRGPIILLAVFVLVVAATWRVAPKGVRRLSRIWAARSVANAAQTTPSTQAPAAPASDSTAKPTVATSEARNPVAKPVQVAETTKPAATMGARGTPSAPAAAVVRSQASTVPHTGFVVQVRALRDAWVQIMADGKLMTDGLLVAAAEKKIHAQKEVVLKTQNAAAVEVSFNGEPLPPLGRENEVATVTFNTGGLRR